MNGMRCEERGVSMRDKVSTEGYEGQDEGIGGMMNI